MPQYGLQMLQVDLEVKQKINVWLANELSPRAINSTVKTIIFIIDNNSELYDEILLHSNILKQFFEVKIISSIDQIQF